MATNCPMQPMTAGTGRVRKWPGAAPGSFPWSEPPGYWTEETRIKTASPRPQPDDNKSSESNAPEKTDAGLWSPHSPCNNILSADTACREETELPDPPEAIAGSDIRQSNIRSLPYLCNKCFWKSCRPAFMISAPDGTPRLRYPDAEWSLPERSQKFP